MLYIYARYPSISAIIFQNRIIVITTLLTGVYLHLKTESIHTSYSLDEAK